MTNKPRGIKRMAFTAAGFVMAMFFIVQNLPPSSAQSLPPRWWWDDLRILCGPSKDMYEGLSKKYNEQPIILAEVASETDETFKTISVWVNKKEDTLTILLTTKDGKKACMVTTGTGVKINGIKTGLEI